MESRDIWHGVFVAAATLTACQDTPPDAVVASDPQQLGARDDSSAEIEVATTDELTTALAKLRPGQRISFRPGEYEGAFSITTAGTDEEPIALCGTADAELSGVLRTSPRISMVPIGGRFITCA